jgi:hypothetical protein
MKKPFSNTNFSATFVSTLITEPMVFNHVVKYGDAPAEFPITDFTLGAFALVAPIGTPVLWNNYATEVVLSDSYISPLGPLQSDLSVDYQELGQALLEMKESDEEEWAIDESVYTMASFVAAALMDYAQPAPKLFSHGSKSVVFNWEEDRRNTYLTVSAGYISALVSSPEQIERRRDVPISNLLGTSQILSAIKAAQIDGPVVTRDGFFDLVHQTTLP